MEASCHRYCIFLTTTYAPEFVPRVVCEPSETGVCDYKFHYITPRVVDDNADLEPYYRVESILDFNMYMNKLFEKTVYPADFGLPVLYKRDAQLFIKRLRKYVYKHTEETFRIYYIGEYGPKHFWPHYHFLLFFDKKETADLLFPPEQRFKDSKGRTVSREGYVFPCWSYGRTDTQFAIDAASYVSSYLANSAALPEILEVQPFKPFSVHSNFLGEGVFEAEFEKIYENPLAHSISTDIKCNGKVLPCKPSSQTFNRFFPRCWHYAESDDDRNIQVYRILQFASLYSEVNTHSLAKLAEEMAIKMCRGWREHFPPTSFDYRYWDLLVHIAGFPSSDFEFDRDFDTDTPAFNRWTGALYRAFRVSHRFLSIVRYRFGNTSWDSCSRFYYEIKRFWSNVGLDSLRRFYESQQNFFGNNRPYRGIDDDVLFYDNCGSGVAMNDELAKLSIYRVFTKDTIYNFENSVKHKKLNDENKIFVSQLNFTDNG